jgi:predicted ATPase
MITSYKSYLLFMQQPYPFSHASALNVIAKTWYSFTRGEGAHSVGLAQNGEPIEGIISYISADRFGPRTSLPLSIEGSAETVGRNGENLVGFLSGLDDKSADGLRTPESLVLGEGTGVIHNIQEWLRVISPGVKFEFGREDILDLGWTKFDEHRPAHVGFGLSYAISIIASVIVHASQMASGKADQILLLVENPEAHLHPSGQTMMGRMLAMAASCGLQIIAETHSDHLLNGVRIAVKDGVLPHADLACYFLRVGEGENPAKVEKLAVDKYGMLDYWPDGFFDETDKNLTRLL